jgi:hypothetical protein
MGLLAAVYESGNGPKRLFTAAQQDVGKGERTGRSARDARTAAPDPEPDGPPDSTLV